MQAIQQSSEEALRIEQGSLYPALHRLIKRGWIAFEHGTSENNWRAKYLSPHAEGTKTARHRNVEVGTDGPRHRPRVEAGMTWRQRRTSLGDLDDDIRDHIVRETEQNIARGMAPDEAYAAAQRAFGSVTLTKEATRAVWVPVWIDQVLQEFATGRTTDDPLRIAPAIRASLAGIDKTRPIFSVETLESVLIDSVAPRLFNVFLLTTFAATALLLAVIGIYGVIAYPVAQRTHEIGVRMALGAERRAVVAMIVCEGMALALAGIALGTVAALTVTRVIAGLLYEIAPTDPATFIAAAVALGVTAFLACAGPALKAALVNPVTALRCD